MDCELTARANEKGDLALPWTRSDFALGGKVKLENAPKIAADDFEIVVAHFNEDLSWLESLEHETTVYSKGTRKTIFYELLPKGLTKQIGSLPQDSSYRDVIQLPNIGRESHTILWHIVHRYDTLANTTMFVQGDLQNAKGVRPHTDLSASQMRDKALTANFGRAVCLGSPGNNKTFNMWDGIDWVNDAENAHWLAKSGSEMKMATITPREFWQRTFGYAPPPSLVYAEASLLAVTAETIRMRSLSFWKYLLAYLVDDGHVNPEYGHYLERFWGEIFSVKSVSRSTVNDWP